MAISFLSPITESFSAEYPEQPSCWEGCFVYSRSNQDGGSCDTDFFLLMAELWIILCVFVLVGSLRAENELLNKESDLCSGNVLLTVES